MGEEPADTILSWYRVHGRSLPWRETADPYAILVSELMLQQTQVDRVIPKYKEWLLAFPDWRALAVAPRSLVLKHWSGLGYNSRAVRLHALAKLVVEEHSGHLPEDEESLRKLPGVGPYTAGAVMAFAFNRKGDFIDVNVERVLKRLLFSISKENISKKEVKWAFNESFPEGEASDWGNALMDFGSLICTPKKPKCDTCPVNRLCKSKGERPEEKKERELKRQPTFLHSNRWWRGQILKRLHASGSTRNALFNDLDHQDKKGFEKALAQLQEEGLVTRGQKVRIAD